MVSLIVAVAGSVGTQQDDDVSASKGSTPPRPTATQDIPERSAERNGASPPVRCFGPFPTDKPVASVTASGFADCDTAGAILAQCANGQCADERVSIAGGRFLCISNQVEDTPLYEHSCVGPGQIITWNSVPT